MDPKVFIGAKIFQLVDCAINIPCWMTACSTPSCDELLRSNVAHCCEHGDSAMFLLLSSTSWVGPNTRARGTGPLCFNSVWRRRLKFSTLPSAVKPAGSQNPTGACTPNSFSKVCRFVAGTAGLGRAPLLPAAKREPQSGSRGRQSGSGRIGNLKAFSVTCSHNITHWFNRVCTTPAANNSCMLSLSSMFV